MKKGFAMKHFLLLLLAALSLISCSEDANPVSSSDVLAGNYFSPKKITVYNSEYGTTIYNFNHDNLGRVTSEVADSLNRLIYTYDNLGNCLTKTRDFFYNNSWQFSDSTYYTYDNQNNLLTKQVRCQNQNYGKDEYTYDGQNRLLTETNWGSSMGQLIPNYRLSNTYSSSLLVSSTYELYTSNAWQMVARTTLYHNAAGQTDSTLRESYYEGNWQKSTMTTNTFNPNGKISSQIYQEWSGTTWRNIFRNSGTYDAKKNLIGTLTENYNNNTASWQPYTKRSYSYSSQNLQTKEECFGYVNNSWRPMYNFVSLLDSDYSFDVYCYKMEVEYAGFTVPVPAARRPGGNLVNDNEKIFEKLLKEAQKSYN